MFSVSCCAPKPSLVQYDELKPAIPADLRMPCMREPKLPVAAENLTDVESASVVASAIVAGRDCRDKADRLQKLLP